MASFVYDGQQTFGTYIKSRFFPCLLYGYLFRGITYVGLSSGHSPTTVCFLAYQQNLILFIENDSSDVNFGGYVFFCGKIAGVNLFFLNTAGDAGDTVAYLDQLLTTVDFVFIGRISQARL